MGFAFPAKRSVVDLGATSPTKRGFLAAGKHATGDGGGKSWREETSAAFLTARVGRTPPIGRSGSYAVCHRSSHEGAYEPHDERRAHASIHPANRPCTSAFVRSKVVQTPAP